MYLSKARSSHFAVRGAKRTRGFRAYTVIIVMISILRLIFGAFSATKITNKIVYVFRYKWPSHQPFSYIRLK